MASKLKYGWAQVHPSLLRRFVSETPNLAALICREKYSNLEDNIVRDACVSFNCLR